MKICIIAEGSYPYATGGVSSWLQMLMTSMPQHQFIIYAIGAQEKDRGKFNYELPGNVLEVKEVFLDFILTEVGVWGNRYRIKNDVREALKDLLMGRDVNWNNLFSFFYNKKFDSVSNFLMSKDFFDILQEVYKEKYPQISFTDFFWTIRSMILPLLYVIKQGVPEADLYHSVSTGYGGIMGSLGKFLYNKPFILTEHGIYTREREEEIIKADWVKIYFKETWIEYFYSLSKCAYNYGDKVISLFNRNKEIQIELGCPEEKIDIIPNGIRIEDFTELKQNDFNDGFINIGAVVRVVPIKDIKTMIQGFAVAKEVIPNIRLYIMGSYAEDIDYFHECKQFVEILQLEDVIFTGNIDVKDYLGKMDFFILSSISEGQPFAVLEGMACSKPYIATDVGSCRELLYGNNDNYGQAGIIVPVMDYEKIGNSIIKLCRDEKLRAFMGSNGFNRVSKLYTKEMFIKGYKNIYNEFKGV